MKERDWLVRTLKNKKEIGIITAGNSRQARKAISGSQNIPMNKLAPAVRV